MPLTELDAYPFEVMLNPAVGAFRLYMVFVADATFHPCHPAGNEVELWLSDEKSVQYGTC